MTSRWKGGVVVSGGATVGELKSKRTRSTEPASDGRPRQTIQKIIDKAAKILGSEDNAMRWLGTPVRALDFATPISLLGNPQGVTRVKNVLGQMENGVW